MLLQQFYGWERTEVGGGRPYMLNSSETQTPDIPSSVTDKMSSGRLPAVDRYVLDKLQAV
jgi:hypothetical protein